MKLTAEDRKEIAAIREDTSAAENGIPGWVIRAACWVYCKLGADWLAKKCGCGEK